MWPFGKKRKADPPADITAEGVTARFDLHLDYWTFEVEGIEFTISIRPFDAEVLGWARSACATIRRLDAEIHRAVSDGIADWKFPVDGRELLNVSLDEYPDNETLVLAFCGDDSWGYYTLDVFITAGRVAGTSGGD
jgi:hypothetical protein